MNCYAREVGPPTISCYAALTRADGLDGAGSEREQVGSRSQNRKVVHLGVAIRVGRVAAPAGSKRLQSFGVQEVPQECFRHCMRCSAVVSSLSRP